MNPFTSPEWRPFRLGVLGAFLMLLAALGCWIQYIQWVRSYNGQVAFEILMRAQQQQQQPQGPQQNSQGQAQSSGQAPSANPSAAVPKP